MILPGVVQPPLLFKIFPVGNNTRWLPRIIAFVRNNQYTVEIRLGILHIRVGLIDCDLLFYTPLRDLYNMYPDTGNDFHLFAAGLPVSLADLRGSGPGMKLDEHTVRCVGRYLAMDKRFFLLKRCFRWLRHCWSTRCGAGTSQTNPDRDD